MAVAGVDSVIGMSELILGGTMRVGMQGKTLYI